MLNPETLKKYKRAAQLIYNVYGLEKPILKAELRDRFKAADLHNEIIRAYAQTDVLISVDRFHFKMIRFDDKIHVKAYQWQQNYASLTMKAMNQRIKNGYKEYSEKNDPKETEKPTISEFDFTKTSDIDETLKGCTSDLDEMKELLKSYGYTVKKPLIRRIKDKLIQYLSK